MHQRSRTITFLTNKLKGNKAHYNLGFKVKIYFYLKEEKITLLSENRIVNDIIYSSFNKTPRL